MNKVLFSSEFLVFLNIFETIPGVFRLLIVSKKSFLHEHLPSHLSLAFELLSFKNYWSLAVLFTVTVGVRAKNSSLRQ